MKAKAFTKREVTAYDAERLSADFKLRKEEWFFQNLELWLDTLNIPDLRLKEQAPIGRYRVDGLLYRRGRMENGLVIEFNEDSHYASSKTIAYDRNRKQVLLAMGLEFMVVRQDDDFEEIQNRVLQKLGLVYFRPKRDTYFSAYISALRDNNKAYATALFAKAEGIASRHDNNDNGKPKGLTGTIRDAGGGDTTLNNVQTQNVMFDYRMSYRYPQTKVELNTKDDILGDHVRMVYAQFRWVEFERGYKLGWAAQKFHLRYKRWPPREWNDDYMFQPSNRTLKWIQADINQWKAKSTAN